MIYIREGKGELTHNRKSLRIAPSGVAMARLTYASRFDLPKDRGIDWPRSAYREWLARRYGLPFEQLPDNLPKRHTIKVAEYKLDDAVVETLDWSFPHDDDLDLAWRNSIRLCESADFVSVEHTIWIDSLDFNIRPVRFSVGSPKVIRRLCAESTVRIGDIDVRATPYRVAAPGTDDLVALLESQRRRIPVVFLAPGSDEQPNLIDANLAAQNLAGVAIVVESDNETTWNLSERVGRLRSCFAGAARIYWPGFSTDADPLMHPLFLGSTIGRVGEGRILREIEKTIFSVACFRFVPDPRIDAVLREHSRRQRLEALADRKAATGADWESYAIELDEKLTGSNQRVSELEVELEILKENQAVLLAYQPEASTPVVSLSRTITTVVEAVEAAATDFSKLRFLDSATKGASKSPFARPSEIYDALSDLDASAEVLFTTGGEMRTLLSERGWGKRCSMHISSTTKNKYGSDYTFQYGGKSELFEPHITIGSGDASSCASIHFIIDSDKKCIVVGHVGKHLPNTNTN